MRRTDGDTRFGSKISLFSSLMNIYFLSGFKSSTRSNTWVIVLPYGILLSVLLIHRFAVPLLHGRRLIEVRSAFCLLLWRRPGIFGFAVTLLFTWKAPHTSTNSAGREHLEAPSHRVDG